MDERQFTFQNSLRFDRNTRKIPGKLFVILGTLIVFTLMWAFVPHNALYWLMLVFLAVSVWMATYGWRQALHILSIRLERLVQI